MIADFYNQKKLAKKIKKKYWKEGQSFCLDTDCYLEYDGQKVSSCDVCFTNKKGYWDDNHAIYLFEIISKPNLYVYDSYPNMKSTNPKHIIQPDYQAMSYQPYYFDRIFFLKNKDFVEKKDILKCAKYFIHNILDIFLVWNYEIVEKKD